MTSDWTYRWRCSFSDSLCLCVSAVSPTCLL